MNTMNHQPVLLIVRGLPGGGKTTISEGLCDVIGADRVMLLDPDLVDLGSETYSAHVAEQTAEGVADNLHLYRFLRAQAYEGIEAGKIIIWNQPFTNLEMFHKVMDRMKEHAESVQKTITILVVEVEIHPDIAEHRIASRKAQGGHGPSGDVWARFVQDYKSFSGNGYDVIGVNGEDKTSSSVDHIIQSLEQRGIL